MKIFYRSISSDLSPYTCTQKNIKRLSLKFTLKQLSIYILRTILSHQDSLNVLLL